MGYNNWSGIWGYIYIYNVMNFLLNVWTSVITLKKCMYRYNGDTLSLF